MKQHLIQAISILLLIAMLIAAVACAETGTGENGERPVQDADDL